MDMRNRVTRLTLSSHGAGNQPQAQTGRMAQEANAFGKAEGYADVGRVYGKARVLNEQCLMTRVSDAVKTERSMNVRLCQVTRQATIIGKFNGWGADDNSPYTQEPDEAKVSCPVLNRRWGGQPPHRPELGPGF
jgi:hypothetical protein